MCDDVGSMPGCADGSVYVMTLDQCLGVLTGQCM